MRLHWEAVPTIVENKPETKSAPGRLELVRNFVNSVDFDDEIEELESPEALRAWFAERGLMGAEDPISEGDYWRAIDVREGLRAILLAHNGHELDRAAVERLDRAAGHAGLRLRFQGDGEPALEADASGVDGALARLLGIVADSVAEGSWERLKACPDETCLWAFYDRSKNRSKRWCRMEACGNVAKARAYRERLRAHG